MRLPLLCSLLLIAVAVGAPAGARTGVEGLGASSLPSHRSVRPRPARRVYAPSPTVQHDVRDIVGRIESARDRGEISRRDARQLKRQARAIGASATLYGRDGLSAPEQMEIQNRTFYLRGLVSSPQVGAVMGAAH